MKRGFTYIELTIVMTIIAILAAIAIPNFLEAQTRARVSAAKSDQAMVKMALDAYRADTRTWPLNSQPGQPEGWGLVCLSTPVAYLSSLPLDQFVMRNNQIKDRQPVAMRSFEYLNGFQLNASEGLRVREATGDFSGFVGGLLIGMGPRLDASPDNIPNTVIQPDGTARLRIYDPTNGTVSPGDIYLRLP